ncbi:PPE family protein [Mycolicibacterium sp. XJ870]
MWAPPEITTGRLMSGPGAGPMLAASQAYTTFANAYEANINVLLAHLGRLMIGWQGPASEVVAVTLTRHIAWLRLLHGQLIATAGRMANQAAAFTTAYSSVVPMPGIVQNKVTKAVAIATNFIGQNFPIITAKEIEYALMGFHNMAVQAGYLGATMANTAFEPFSSPAPLVTTDASVPPGQSQDVATPAEQLQLAAIRAQADAEAAISRFRETHLDQLDQLAQQALQQAPQYAAAAAGMLFQQAQQVGQQVVQVPQQIVGSLMGNLTNNISPEYRIDEPGFFDTRADSPALDRLSGVGSGSGAAVAGLNVTGLGGLSGASTGFRFPASWDVPPATAVTPPQAAAPSGAAARPIGPTMAPLAGANHGRDQDHTIKRPVTELIPVWGNGDNNPVETVSVGDLTRERQEAS